MYMRQQIYFLPFLISVFFCGTVFADINEPKFTYRKDTETYIPASHELKHKATIDAPIGDNGLLSPIIKLKINGHGPYNFMFDTGFSQSMISAALAKKLNLPQAETEKVRSITPSQVVDTFQHIYLVDKIEVGDVVIRHYGVFASSGFEDEVQDLKKLKVDGVLSANAFYGLLLTLDYKNEKIYLERGNLLHSPQNELLHLEKRDVPVIKAKIKFNKLNKLVEQNFILDTGFGSYFYVNSCNIPEMLKFKGRENLLSYDYLGFENKKYFAQLFGDVILSNSILIKSPHITFGPVNCELGDPYGLIGRTFFEKNRVTFDQVNGLVKINRY